MKKGPLYLCGAAAAAVCVLYHTLAPKGVPFSPAPVPISESWTFVPLDDRPPCRRFTEELGALAGIHFAAPPHELMDWYEVPAHIPQVWDYVEKDLPGRRGALLSTDLLLFGGLLHSRLVPADAASTAQFFDRLEALMEKNPQKEYSLFTVIPRLLISDQVLPDRWYQWHLMTWAVNMDKKIRGLPYDEPLYESVKKEIPMDLKWKYMTLYRDNDTFNQMLIDFSTKHPVTDLVIGQDDAHPFGLPNYNRLNVKSYVKNYDVHPPIMTSQGADELGALAASRIYLQESGHRPRVKVLYGSDAMKDYTLPFVPLTLQEIAEEKIALSGAVETASDEEADYYLFIHCGTDRTENYRPVAHRVKTLMKEKPLALVDLSMHFAGGECLLPTLVKEEVPIGRLLAYSGWNTASNAIGTAVAQGNIVSMRAHDLPQNELPRLYAQNLTFNAARFLDDWAYQKVIRPHMTVLAGLNGSPEVPVSEKSLAGAQDYLGRELFFYKTLLVWALRQEPFYQDQHDAYYLQDLSFESAFPWQRAFEIDLTVHPKFGKKELTKE